MKTENFQRSSFLLIVAAATILFLWMIRDFLLTLFLGAVFTGLSHPLFQWVKSKTNGRKKTAASFTLLILFFMVGIPAFLFIGLVTNEAVKVTETAGPWIQEHLQNRGQLGEALSRVPGYELVEPYRNLILSRAGEVTGNLGKILISRLSAITTGTLSFLLHLALMIYAMFFFFTHGEDWLRKIFHLLPLEHEHEMRLLANFHSMTRATVKGTLVIGVVQGGLAGMALAVAGVPSALFWSTVMMFASILPTVGTGLVWLPASVILMIQGEVLKGILVIAWCAIVVGTVDNILRPILVGKDTKMHELLILISTLGGLVMFGLAGFIIGPVIASLFVTIWTIYGELFQGALPPVKDLNPEKRNKN